ncbi:MAG: hypothetical protein ABL894_14840 [Hyphomicrobium sp.]
MLNTQVRSLACLIALIAGSHAAEAGWRHRNQDEPGVVTAQSRHGNGAVTGPVRAGRTGFEVRLPGGTWTACRRSCSETLRVETVDFWENDGRLVGAGSAANECGIFGCLDIHYPR